MSFPLKHGQAGNNKDRRPSRAYRSWSAMKARCDNKNATYYRRYGGRGINYSSEWSSFASFFADMGPRPKGTSLGRIDNDGNYCKDNCEWQRPKSQAKNRLSNSHIKFNGETRILQEWADLVGIPRDALWRRLHRYGWSISKAITTPTRKQKNSRGSFVGQYCQNKRAIYKRKMRAINPSYAR